MHIILIEVCCSILSCCIIKYSLGRILYMRIERLSNDQFTIFLTFDDLIERGFTKDDLWRDASSVRDLFSDMMYEASDELGIELEGMLIVHVMLMQAQGMHVIVTKDYENVDLDDQFIEMKVTLDESNTLLFSFTDFENVIDVAHHLDDLDLEGGILYHMDNRYYMLLTEDTLKHLDKEDIIAVMSEYANPSIITTHRLKEYGKIIFQANAIKQINQYF